MFANIISWTAVALILLAAGAMLVDRDWRVQLAALAIQYLASAWLVSRHLPFAMASAKLVTGWMVVAALGMTRLGIRPSLEESDEGLRLRGQSFPLILLGIVALAAAGAAPRVEAATPGIGVQVIAGGILLIGAGLINLSLSADILRVALGLLTMLSGFEIIYAAVESSILVTGLLAVTNLGLGLVGSYLLVADAASRTAVEENLF